MLVPMAGIDSSGLTYAEQLIFLEYQLDQSKCEEKLLVAELAQQRIVFDHLFEGAQLLDKENRELAHKRELFSAVRQHLDEKNMERKVPGPIEVLSRAFAPSEPNKDRRVLFTAIVLVLSLGMSACLAMLHRRRAA